MKEKDKIIYFEVNNWYPVRDYPVTKKFIRWMSNDLHLGLERNWWAKWNKLCINVCHLDMATAFMVSAPLKWVSKNCPEILNSVFEKHSPNGIDLPISSFGEFLKYDKKNFGVHWILGKYEEELMEDEEG